LKKEVYEEDSDSAMDDSLSVTEQRTMSVAVLSVEMHTY
jgi:hypothetical protein